MMIPIDIIAILCKFILAFVLGLSGLMKLRNVEATIETIKKYGIESKTVSKIIGLTLPAIEVVLSALLLFTRTSMFLLGLVSVLFGIFSIATVVNIHRGNKIPCGCFGLQDKQYISWRSALRTGAFFLSSVSITFTANQVNINSGFNMNSTILVVGGLILSFIGLLLILEPKSRMTQISNRMENDSTKLGLNRRDALKIFIASAAALLALFIPMSKAKAYCCSCQYYDHFEPGCCFDIYRLRHYFRRCCNPCNGVKGQWRKYQPDLCPSTCTCMPSQECDVMYGCGGAGCYPGECCSV